MFEEWYENVGISLPCWRDKGSLARAWGAGEEEERERCAKKLEDLAAIKRASKFPHVNEEKAQILEWAAAVLRSGDG